MAAHPIQDLEFWYNSGPGQPTSAVQGIGYILEPVSRLTQMPITNFYSTVNDTILSFRAVITALNFTKPGSEWASTD